MLRKFSLLSNLLALAVSGISLFCIILLMNTGGGNISEKDFKANVQKVKELEGEMVQVQSFIKETTDKIGDLEGDIEDIQVQNESFLQLIEEPKKDPADVEDPAKEPDNVDKEEPKEEPKKEEPKKDDKVTEVKNDNKKEKLTVRTDYLHFRKEPGLNGEVITRFHTGDTVKNLNEVVMKDNYYWRKVHFRLFHADLARY